MLVAVSAVVKKRVLHSDGWPWTATLRGPVRAEEPLTHISNFDVPPPARIPPREETILCVLIGNCIKVIKSVYRVIVKQVEECWGGSRPRSVEAGPWLRFIKNNQWRNCVFWAFGSGVGSVWKVRSLIDRLYLLNLLITVDALWNTNCCSGAGREIRPAVSATDRRDDVTDRRRKVRTFITNRKIIMKLHGRP